LILFVNESQYKNDAQQIEKYPQSPLLKPRIKCMLRGFVVYFWVDRLRRKLAIREKVSTLLFQFVWFLKFCFAFTFLSTHVIFLGDKDCCLKLGVMLFTCCFCHYFFLVWV